jgi:hypothetical protein
MVCRHGLALPLSRRHAACPSPAFCHLRAGPWLGLGASARYHIRDLSKKNVFIFSLPFGLEKIGRALPHFHWWKGGCK